MRVFQVTGEYRPLQGGVGDYTHELSAALKGLGVDVRILTRLAPQGEANVCDLPGDPPVYRVIPRWNWRALSRVWQLAREERPQILHIQYQTAAYDMHPAINFLPWLKHFYLGRRGPRVVVTFHDTKVPYLFPKAGWLREWVTTFMAQQSDAIIVTNAEDQARFASVRLRRPARLIPIGSNIAAIRLSDHDRDRWRAHWGFTPEDFVLGYFGFLNESKGGEVLIKVLDSLVKRGYNCRLLMIGGRVGSSDPTNRAYAQQIDALIESLGLSNRVVWTGFLEAAEVSANFAAVDVCVLPYRDGASFRRGSFMAALEHGCPIVSTWPRVPIPELKDGENILLALPDNVSALAMQVEMLIRDPQRRATIGAGAKALSRSFGWDYIARQTLEVYCDLGESEP